MKSLIEKVRAHADYLDKLAEIDSDERGASVVRRDAARWRRLADEAEKEIG
jgi:hypothetical protein